MKFAIWQVPPKRRPRGYFDGEPVDPELYEVVWERELGDIEDIADDLAWMDDGDVLDWAWEKFNIDHPSDFKGHSLSIGDVVQIGNKFYKVARVGFYTVTGEFKDRGGGR